MRDPMRQDDNHAALAAIATRERELDAEEKDLLKALADIEAQRRALAESRVTIEAAERVKAEIFTGWLRPSPRSEIHGEDLDPFLGAAPTPKGIGQARARIGDKRYHILATLREAGPLLLSEIVARTGQEAGRIKEQFKKDIPMHVEGTMVTTDGRMQKKFQLTPVGFELLDRFEACRLSRGEPLPKRPSSSVIESAAREVPGYVD